MFTFSSSPGQLLNLKRKLIFIPRKKSLTSYACQLQRKLILNMRGNDAIRACIKYQPCKVLINLRRRSRKWPDALCTIFTILLTLWNSEQKNGLLIKLFRFSSDFDETWWSCSYSCVYVLQFHQVSSKSDEKQKSFIINPFFCSEFQSVSRIVKIVHSGKFKISWIFG